MSDINGDELLDTVEYFMEQTKASVTISYISAGPYEGMTDASAIWSVEGQMISAHSRGNGVREALEMMLSRIDRMPPND